MKPDSRAMKLLLRRREAQLQTLMRQMKRDHLDASQVYRDLEEELRAVRTKITTDALR